MLAASPAEPHRPTMHPLKRLLGHAADRRGDIRLATVWSVLNKVFDVLPEILIGVAVDVVVNRHDYSGRRSSLEQTGQSDNPLAGATGVARRHHG
ncbi:MAG: hypothetical protein KF823_03645 [Xanthomonadales bacterium]|nr:hypothetical protein [Xanthomonadales bacterium]